jgi:hypothetical protein
MAHGGLEKITLAFFSPPSIVQALIDPYQALLLSITDRGSEDGKKWGKQSVVAFPHTLLRALKDEGWAFMFSFRMFGRAWEKCLWGFVR